MALRSNLYSATTGRRRPRTWQRDMNYAKAQALPGIYAEKERTNLEKARLAAQNKYQNEQIALENRRADLDDQTLAEQKKRNKTENLLGMGNLALNAGIGTVKNWDAISGFFDGEKPDRSALDLTKDPETGTFRVPSKTEGLDQAQGHYGAWDAYRGKEFDPAQTHSTAFANPYGLESEPFSNEARGTYSSGLRGFGDYEVAPQKGLTPGQFYGEVLEPYAKSLPGRAFMTAITGNPAAFAPNIADMLGLFSDAPEIDIASTLTGNPENLGIPGIIGKTKSAYEALTGKPETLQSRAALLNRNIPQTPEFLEYQKNPLLMRQTPESDYGRESFNFDTPQFSYYDPDISDEISSPHYSPKDRGIISPSETLSGKSSFSSPWGSEDVDSDFGWFGYDSPDSDSNSGWSGFADAFGGFFGF